MKDEIKEILDYIDDRVISSEKWNKVKDYIIYLQEENKKLNKKYEDAVADYEEQKYIINELEKYIKENSIYYNTSDGCQWVDQFKVLDKLNELKESRGK